jgi:hypothetical protein
MDESIGQPVAKAGVDGVVAEKTVGIMLGFARSEGRSEKVETLIDRIPRAEAAIVATNSGSGISGFRPGHGLLGHVDIPRGCSKKRKCLGERTPWRQLDPSRRL